MAAATVVRRRAGQLVQTTLPNASTATTCSTSRFAPIASQAQAQAPSLIPDCPSSRPSSSRPFSTTPSLGKRRVRFRDNNPNRGVSVLYRSGPREPRSMSRVDLPRPRDVDLKKLAAERVDPDHGLWEFFYDKMAANTPAESGEHGRSWTVEELRAKSWDDLHKLWWVCCKERNRIATAANMREEYEMGFGDNEGDERDAVVLKTMKSIKHTLTERWYAWEDAVKLAKEDPEIDLTAGEGQAYTPRDYLSEEEIVEAQITAPKKGEGTSIPPPPPTSRSRDVRGGAKI
ncbi:uncharacterized protein MKZ38_003248 [Zalerion maritima]|uniref:Large ribosomal subunit protein uL29m n=1 Tax=Zalerion maritima TaxID=339359 RepID=A0AAD5S068_9PEZI|nr:uncharacterized protein MKZ38_003248 [Zalerion maritima]